MGNTKKSVVSEETKKVNEYGTLLTNATECVLTVRTLDDKGVDDIVKAYKRSAWDFAKICYLFNKVEGIKLETLQNRFGIDVATINKHANNVAFLLKQYKKGFDKVAEMYSVSKVDLLRKAVDVGCYKGVKFEDAIQKKRSDIEKAIKSKTANTDNTADTKDTPTVSITMTDENGRQIVRLVPTDEWERWYKEYMDSKAE